MQKAWLPSRSRSLTGLNSERISSFDSLASDSVTFRVPKSLRYSQAGIKPPMGQGLHISRSPDVASM